MTHPFVSLGLKSGVWEGRLPDGPAPARVALTLNGRTVGQAEVTPGAEGGWNIRAALPVETLSEGVQTYTLIADDGAGVDAPRPGAMRLGHLPLLAGEALDADLRAKIDLLRAEVDLLKREFRRLATE
ncbi:hypothetical protein [Paracoccus sanguinis]|uniref:Uncharacterized protein n=1 Tax=Paracoccus sanguinis TaxID=1545044 RepID=A0A099GBX9_9RHOB|nr:hypothetical protein [Paracoccus sanguinis]KGJ20052.1 hypothetical protein IX56_14810 [Paracoccus sanguinis]